MEFGSGNVLSNININHKRVIIFESDTKILYISPAHRKINYLCLVLVSIANDYFLLRLLFFTQKILFYCLSDFAI